MLLQAPVISLVAIQHLTEKQKEKQNKTNKTEKLLANSASKWERKRLLVLLCKLLSILIMPYGVLLQFYHLYHKRTFPKTLFCFALPFSVCRCGGTRKSASLPIPVS